MSRRRSSIGVSSGLLNPWGALVEQFKAAERPAGSITTEEFAKQTGLSYPRAGDILRGRADLRQVVYRKNGKRAVAYVPAD